MELAIYADCQRLVKDFVKNGTPDFQSFCEQWKAMFFQHIYSVQTTTVELLQTTAALLQAAKHEIKTSARDDESKSQTQLRHVAALYLMYVVYFKQPTELYVKIEVGITLWESITGLISSLPQQPLYDDVHYVFWKLVRANAFRFTALDYCVGLEPLVDYDRIFTEKNDLVEISLKHRLKHYEETRARMPIVTILEDGYNEMKEQLSAEKSIDSKALPPTTVFNDIKKLFDRVDKIMENNNLNLETKPTNIETKRQGLKRKGFTVDIPENKNAQDSVTKADDTAPSKKLMRRMSSRTIFSEELPKEMLMDLDNTDGQPEDSVMEDVN